ncbi:hypothetical protein [Bradyrhizobium phage BDU-MI-1]|nr:hypothetical protein [Bradyrhizobium phage BDU-MI-1]
MVSAMVASSKTQAEAMIRWLALDPLEWVPVAYGQQINNLYQDVKLVRPSEGVHKEHVDWVLEKLVPRVCKFITTVPPYWRIPQDHLD